MERNSLQTQLAPGWSGVNIALMAVLFYVWWPLGLAMIAYIIWGEQFGLNLGRPESFRTAGQRITGQSSGPHGRHADHSGTAAGGTPVNDPGAERLAADRDEFERWRQQESERLLRERETLERERREFDASKRDTEA